MDGYGVDGTVPWPIKRWLIKRKFSLLKLLEIPANFTIIHSFIHIGLKFDVGVYWEYKNGIGMGVF